jgi:hypothetical protein
MPTRTSGPLNALAIFAAVLFALGLAAIVVLDRIGAPVRLVQAGGPALTLLGLVVFGLGARSADLASFLAAGRNVPPLYGGLALAAAVAGAALCLYPGLAWSSGPPPIGAAAGAAVGAIGLGPLLRRFGATSAIDVVATRFPGSPALLVSGIVAWASTALTAFAGFRIAVGAAEAMTANRQVAEMVVAAVLLLSVAPGGLAGVIWCAAASAGEIAVIGAFGQGVLPSPPPGADLTSLGFNGSASLTALLATAVAVGGFFAFQSQAIASRDAGSAVRAGVIGAVLSLALIALAAIALSAFGTNVSPHSDHAFSSSLAGAAILAASLTLARAGVHESSRAFGVALAKTRRAYPTPASVRLARMRAAQIGLVACCAICDSKGFLDARTALLLSMALWLAMTTPMIALAAMGRVGPFSASVAALSVLVVGVARATATARPLVATDVFENALSAAAAGFLVGVLVSFVAPRRALPPTPGQFDPYGSASG